MSTTNHHRGKDDKEHLSKTRENTGSRYVIGSRVAQAFWTNHMSKRNGCLDYCWHSVEPFRSEVTFYDVKFLQQIQDYKVERIGKIRNKKTVRTWFWGYGIHANIRAAIITTHFISNTVVISQTRVITLFWHFHDIWRWTCLPIKRSLYYFMLFRKEKRKPRGLHV